MKHRCEPRPRYKSRRIQRASRARTETPTKPRDKSLWRPVAVPLKRERWEFERESVLKFPRLPVYMTVNAEPTGHSHFIRFIRFSTDRPIRCHCSGIIRSLARRIRVYLLPSMRHARPAGGVASRVYACASTRNTGPGHGKRQAITQPAGI